MKFINYFKLSFMLFAFCIASVNAEISNPTPTPNPNPVTPTPTPPPNPNPNPTPAPAPNPVPVIDVLKNPQPMVLGFTCPITHNKVDAPNAPVPQLINTGKVVTNAPTQAAARTSKPAQAVIQQLRLAYEQDCKMKNGPTATVTMTDSELPDRTLGVNPNLCVQRNDGTWSCAFQYIAKVTCCVPKN